jgi:2-dehydro-3-deoxygalactonokinase
MSLQRLVTPRPRQNDIELNTPSPPSAILPHACGVRERFLPRAERMGEYARRRVGVFQHVLFSLRFFSYCRGMSKPFIGLDWGTTSFRAYLVDSAGNVTDQVAKPEGILAVKDGAFEAALENAIGAWDKTLPLIASGMITSRQGWVEIPYVDCPAGPDELAKAVVTKTLASGRTVHFLTGLHLASPSLGHDVMRSEETQVFGALETGAQHFVTPGTHSKWIDIEDGRITNFATYITGETFAVMKAHSILGRLMANDTDDEEAFLKGVDRAFADPAGLLHNLFSTRSLALYNELQPESLSSYLSGLIIGAEVAHAVSMRDSTNHYAVLASPGIGAKYITAMKAANLRVTLGDPLAIVKGERLVAQAAGII